MGDGNTSKLAHKKRKTLTEIRKSVWSETNEKPSIKYCNETVYIQKSWK